MIKQISFLLGIFLVAFASIVHAEEIEIPLDGVLFPKYGYELKNNIQIVLYGYLPNACYTLGEVKVEKTLENNLVRVKQYAYRDRSGVCAEDAALPVQMAGAIPFQSEASLGKLAVGDFNIIYESSKGGRGQRTLNVAPNATPRIDSFPYAVISGVSAPSLINGVSSIEAVISGVLTSTCMALNDEIKVVKESDVFVILPTVKLKPGVLCTESIIPFEKKIDLGTVSPGRYLIHARSMNGKAVNQVIQVGR